MAPVRRAESRGTALPKELHRENRLATDSSSETQEDEVTEFRRQTSLPDPDASPVDIAGKDASFPKKIASIDGASSSASESDSESDPPEEKYIVLHKSERGAKSSAAKQIEGESRGNRKGKIPKKHNELLEVDHTSKPSLQNQRKQDRKTVGKSTPSAKPLKKQKRVSSVNSSPSSSDSKGADHGPKSTNKAEETESQAGKSSQKPKQLKKKQDGSQLSTSNQAKKRKTAINEETQGHFLDSDSRIRSDPEKNGATEHQEVERITSPTKASKKKKKLRVSPSMKTAEVRAEDELPQPPSISQPVKTPQKEQRENPVKRASEITMEGGADSDKPKEKENDPVAEERKTRPFQRVWGEDVELEMLNCLNQYIKERGTTSISSNLNDFYDHIKSSLPPNITKAKLKSKVSVMKKKYEDRVNKINRGVQKSFSSDHEQKVFQISHDIWGGSAPLPVQAPPLPPPLAFAVTHELPGKEEGDEKNPLPWKPAGLHECLSHGKLGLYQTDEKIRSQVSREWKKVEIAFLEFNQWQIDFIRKNACAVSNSGNG